MIRGIFFILESKYDFILSKILDGIDVDEFYWTIKNAQAYSSKASRVLADWDSRFDKKMLKGKELLKIAEALPEYLLDFGEFKGFSGKENIKKIDTYNDFINSDCQIIILIADTRYVDIYVKNIGLLELIKYNAQKYGCEETEYITDENDERTTMHVW